MQAQSLAQRIRNFPSDTEWANGRALLLPESARNAALAEWERRRRTPDYRSGNLWLLDLTTESESLLKSINELRDQRAIQHLNQIVATLDTSAIRAAAAITNSREMKEAIRCQSIAEEQIVRQCGDDLKARRRARLTTKQATAKINMRLGLIGGNTSTKHATHYEIGMRNQQKARHRRMAEKTTLYRDEQEVNLLSIISGAGKRRAAELYTLTKGLELHAKRAGMDWAFLTLTAPAHMHPNPSVGKNTWDGTTPDAAHKWIHKAWRRAESRLRKQGIVVAGLRVVEPHADACPHWHVLVFAHASEMEQIESTLRQQPEWKSEAGMKFVRNDGRAAAASYVMKYITKTIGSIEKLEGEHASVDAWRSTWAIRAFQFFGMPSLTTWRELRKLKEAPNGGDLLAGVWRAAKRGDGAGFIGLMGGLGIKSCDRPIKCEKTDDATTKTSSFTVREDGEITTETTKKWERTKPKTGTVEVIPNYPSNPPCGLRETGKKTWGTWANLTPPFSFPFSEWVGLASNKGWVLIKKRAGFHEFFGAQRRKI